MRSTRRKHGPGVNRGLGWRRSRHRTCAGVFPQVAAHVILPCVGRTGRLRWLDSPPPYEPPGRWFCNLLRVLTSNVISGGCFGNGPLGGARMARSGPCMHGTATLWVSLTSAAKEVVAAKCGPWERVLLVDDDPDVGALVSLALGQLRVARWRYAARRSMRSSAPDPSGPTSSPGCHDAGKGVPEAMGDGGHSQAFRSGPPSRNAERDLQRAADQSSVPEGFRRPPRCIPERAPREKRCHGSGWHEPTVESLMHMAHGLAGSSALDRVDGLARAAGILEAMLKRLLEAPRWPPSRRQTRWQRL
jgi:hypothetical protein